MPMVCSLAGMHGTVVANYAVNDADLLLALGVRFDDRVTGDLPASCKPTDRSQACHPLGSRGQRTEERSYPEWLSYLQLPLTLSEAHADGLACSSLCQASWRPLQSGRASCTSMLTRQRSTRTRRRTFPCAQPHRCGASQLLLVPSAPWFQPRAARLRFCCAVCSS